MDTSFETEILFSALEFTNSLHPKGLIAISQSDHRATVNFNDKGLFFLENRQFVDDHPDLRKWGSVDDKRNVHREIVKTLQHAILEIVNGVEFEHTKFEQDHWKFKMVSILFTLALRGELVTATPESQEVLESLECFPSLSLSLAFELVKECDLQVAFVEFLQSVNAEVNLHLLSNAIKYLQEDVDSANNKSKCDNVLFYVVSHVLLHSDGLLVQPLREDLLEEVCNCVMKLTDVVMTLISKDDAQSDECSPDGDKYRYLTPGIVGLLNFASLLHSGSFVCYDIFSLEKCDMDIFTWPRTSKPECSKKNLRAHYQDCMSKYKFESITDAELMLRVFEDDMKGCLEVITVTVAPDFRSNILKTVVASLKGLLLLEQVNKVLCRELGFAQDPRNILYSSQVRWNYSCINRIVLKQIFEQLLKSEMSGRTHGKDATNPDGQHCCGLFEIMDDPTLIHLTRERTLSQIQQMEKSIFVIGERLQGFEGSFCWLLSVVHNEPCLLNEAILNCFTTNVDLLKEYDRVQKLMDVCVHVSDRGPHSNQQHTVQRAKTLKKLFIEVFSRLSLPQQCELLSLFYCNVSNPWDFFEVSHDKIHAAITSLLNKLIGTDKPMSSDSVYHQFAALALQDPNTLVTEAVHSAVRNTHHIQILGKCLQMFQPVSRFKRSGENETVLCSGVSQMMAQADSLTEKQTNNLLSLVQFLVKPAGGKSVLADVEMLISKHIIPLVFGVGPETIPVVVLGPNWMTALRLLNSILKILIENNQYLEADMSTGGGSVNPLQLLAVVCCLLNDINKSLEADKNIALLDAKALLVTCVELLTDLILANTDKVHVDEMRLVLVKLSQQMEWYSICYLQPMVKCFNRIITTDRKHEGSDVFGEGREYIIHLPNCVSEVVALEDCMCGDIVSQSTSPLLGFLRLCSVSDNICCHLCENIRQSFVVVMKSELLLCLAMLLPIALPLEWKRIQAALISLCQNGCFRIEEDWVLFHGIQGGGKADLIKGGDLNNTSQVPSKSLTGKSDVTTLTKSTKASFGYNVTDDILQCRMYECILDAVLVVIVLNTDDKVRDFHFKGVFVKGLLSIYTQEGLTSVKNTLRYGQYACCMAHLYKLCQVISQVSEGHQDQLMTVLLEVLGIMEKDQAMTRDITAQVNLGGESLVDQSVLRKALSPLPQNVMGVVLKKFKLV